jgi:hypothetical protein
MSGQVVQQLAVATTDVENFAFQMLCDPGKPCMVRNRERRGMKVADFRLPMSRQTPGGQGFCQPFGSKARDRAARQERRPPGTVAT